MTNLHADHLRRRARHLLHVAGAIDATPALRLHECAREDTWRGRRPLLCENLLATNRRQATEAILGLRLQAFLMEQRAQQLELAAALEARLAG
jgi:hypothetical protein